jgi:hypothetical protein
MQTHRSLNDSSWSWISKSAEERALADGGSKLLLVYYALCRLESDVPVEAKKGFFASTNQIARHSGLSSRTVQSALPLLELSGLATVISGRGAGDKGSHIANRYTLLQIHPPYALDANTPYATGADTHTQFHHEIVADNKELKEKERVVDEKPKRSKSPTKSLPSIPTELDTPIFRTSWENWIQHRREIRKPLTPSSASKQLKQLNGWGADKATASLDEAIHKGWKGFYEPKGFFQTNDQIIPSVPKSLEPKGWKDILKELYPNAKAMPWDQLVQLTPEVADEVRKVIADKQPDGTTNEQKAA